MDLYEKQKKLKFTIINYNLVLLREE